MATETVNRGIPHVEIAQGEKVALHVELNESLSKKIVESKAKGPITISLDHLTVTPKHKHEAHAGGKVSAQLYRGMPQVEITDETKVAVHVELNESLSQKIAENAAQGPISISLESLNVDLQNNQSFGMIAASTGCISNPGGPSC